MLQLISRRADFFHHSIRASSGILGLRAILSWLYNFKHLYPFPRVLMVSMNVVEEVCDGAEEPSNGWRGERVASENGRIPNKV